MVKIDIDMPKSCSDCTIRKIMGCRIANESGWLSNRRDERCLLKSDEPRVMTLDEIYACSEGDCLYYQCEGEFDGNVLYIRSEVGFYVDLRAAIHRFTCDPSLYGSLWRCWTYRPSAELMASTPWEVGEQDG